MIKLDELNEESAGRFQITTEINCVTISSPENCIGLTKREYFATLALQGVIAGDMFNFAKDRAEYAVKCADALIEALNVTNR